jgi:hypothetical protein
VNRPLHAPNLAHGIPRAQHLGALVGKRDVPFGRVCGPLLAVERGEPVGVDVPPQLCVRGLDAPLCVVERLGQLLVGVEAVREPGGVRRRARGNRDT